MGTLKDDIDKLPPELQQEVRDIVTFLLKKRGDVHAGSLEEETVAGALKEKKEDYASETTLNPRIATSVAGILKEYKDKSKRDQENQAWTKAVKQKYGSS